MGTDALLDSNMFPDRLYCCLLAMERTQQYGNRYCHRNGVYPVDYCWTVYQWLNWANRTSYNQQAFDDDYCLSNIDIPVDYFFEITNSDHHDS